MDAGLGGSRRQAEGAAADATAGAVSRHALRTPLLAIRNASELLVAGAGGPLAASARELVGAIAAAVAALEPLVELLLRAALAGGRGYRAVVLERALATAGIDRAGGSADVRVRAEPEAFAVLLLIAARALGPPLVVRIGTGRRTGAVLLELAGRGPPPLDAEGRRLVAGLVAALARRAGVRRVAADPGRIAFVLAAARTVTRSARDDARRGRSGRGGGGGGAGAAGG